MWRSEDEMLELVRQRAGDRRRRHRFLTATASVGVVVAVAVGAAALAGDDRGEREIRVAGAVGGGRAEGAGGTTAAGPVNAVDVTPAVGPESSTTTAAAAGGSGTSDPYLPSPGVTALPPDLRGTTTTIPQTEPASPTTPVNPDTPVSSPILPPPSGPIGDPSPTRVPVKANAVELRARPFESSVVVGPSSVAVRFWGGIAPCDVVGRVDVVEASHTVTITVYRGREPGPEVACIAIASYQEVLVELSSPLAGRTIVDGAA